MTICIAAICDVVEGLYPKIVFAADRLVSAGVQFEHGQAKIEQLTDSTYVMMSSNDSLKSHMIIKSTIKKIGKTNHSIEDVVKMLASECEQAEKLEREKNVLSKFGLTYETLVEKSRSMSQDFIRIMTSELESFESDFDGQFLIFGLEPAPHIYIVDKYGNYKLNDFVGFAVIGSGYSLSFADLTKYTYHPSIPMAVTLVRVYNAKKVAERIGGVGKEITDLYVLHTIEDNNKKKIVTPWQVPDEIIKILDDGIQTMKDKELQTYGGILKKIDEFFTKSKDSEKSQPNKEPTENLSS